MTTRIMILPYGDTLLNTIQFVGFNEFLRYHLYWIHTDGCKYVSVKNKRSRACLINVAQKHKWTISFNNPGVAYD